MYRLNPSSLRPSKLASYQWIRCESIKPQEKPINLDKLDAEGASAPPTSGDVEPHAGSIASIAKPISSVIPGKKPIDYIINSTETFIKPEQLEPMPEDEVMRKSLSFDEIPGPYSLRYLSKMWNFIPAVGTLATASTIQYFLSAGRLFGSWVTWGGSAALFTRMLNEYGPVVRMHGPFGGDVVILLRPEHASIVFENEGRYPVRSCLDSVEKYRIQYRRYKQAGPFVMYGPEWEKLRKTIEQPLQKAVILSHDEIEKSCDEFVTRILRIRNRQEEVPAGFKNEIFKWAMECMCSVTLNKRLGFLDPCGLSPSSEPARLLDGLLRATEAVRKCEYGFQMWKLVETPAWKQLVKHCDVIDTILSKYIYKAQETLRQKKNAEIKTADSHVSFLENLLIKDGMLPEDVLTVLLDTMIIGVNAVSHTVSFLLYHLARNPRAQKKLYEEIKFAPLKVSKNDLAKMPFLQACIRESLRLKPPMPTLTRVLPKDALIHNYRIPKGTYVVITTYLSCLREEHFEDALKFKPERWLDADMSTNVHVFASLPFGHGPKGCLARELSEMEISLLMIKLMQKFRIEYLYGDIKIVDRFIPFPSRPLKFRFADRL